MVHGDNPRTAWWTPLVRGVIKLKKDMTTRPGNGRLGQLQRQKVRAWKKLGEVMEEGPKKFWQTVLWLKSGKCLHVHTVLNVDGELLTATGSRISSIPPTQRV